MAGPLVRSTEAPREGRVTGASTGLETELFVALQNQDDEADVEVDEEREKRHARFTCSAKNSVLFADQHLSTALRISSAALT